MIFIVRCSVCHVINAMFFSRTSLCTVRRTYVVNEYIIEMQRRVTNRFVRFKNWFKKTKHYRRPASSGLLAEMHFIMMKSTSRTIYSKTNFRIENLLYDEMWMKIWYFRTAIVIYTLYRGIQNDTYTIGPIGIIVYYNCHLDPKRMMRNDLSYNMIYDSSSMTHHLIQQLWSIKMIRRPS